MFSRGLDKPQTLLYQPNQKQSKPAPSPGHVTYCPFSPLQKPVSLHLLPDSTCSIHPSPAVPVTHSILHDVSHLPPAGDTPLCHRGLLAFPAPPTAQLLENHIALLPGCSSLFISMAMGDLIIAPKALKASPVMSLKLPSSSFCCVSGF